MGWRLYLFGAFLILMLTVSAEAADCFCSSCIECGEKLNDTSCDVIYLTADITDHDGDCITRWEEFTNKTFDCQGHTIDGDGGSTAIEAGHWFLGGEDNFTIRNCVITDWGTGIQFAPATNSNITNNTVSGCGTGIWVTEGSSNVYVTGNTITSCTSTGALYVRTSSGNTFVGNNVDDNDAIGLYLFNADSNVFSHNTFNGNNNGIWADSGSSGNTITFNEIGNNENYGVFTQMSSENNNLTSNTLCANTRADINESHGHVNVGDNNTCDTTHKWNDSSVSTGCTTPCPFCACQGDHYNFTCGDAVNESCALTCTVEHPGGTCFDVVVDDITLDGAGYRIIGDAMYGILVSGQDNVTVKNFKIDESFNGIGVSDSTGINIINNTLTNSQFGIKVDDCAALVITENYAGDADQANHGIYVTDTTGSVISHNTLYDNAQNGLYLGRSSYNRIESNVVNENGYRGIWVHQSTYNNFTNNTAESNDGFGSSTPARGFRITQSSHNRFIANTAWANLDYFGQDEDYGMHAIYSHNNTYTNNTVGRSDYGLALDTCFGSAIEGTHATQSVYGIYVYNSGGIYQDSAESIPYEWHSCTPATAADNTSAYDDYLFYELPWTLDYFGRSITDITASTEGLIELLEDGESCEECDESYTHFN